MPNKKADPEKPDPRKWGEIGTLSTSYLGAPVPLGEAAGGQGVPLDEPPAEFPWLLPEVEGDDPEFDELEAPVFGFEEPVDPAVPGSAVPGPAVPGPAVPGKVPHGEPLGVVPGAFVVFGLTVEG